MSASSRQMLSRCYGASAVSPSSQSAPHYLPRKNEFETHVGELITTGKVHSRSIEFEGFNSVPEAF
jgi:hypothetical protein